MIITCPGYKEGILQRLTGYRLSHINTQAQNMGDIGGNSYVMWALGIFYDAGVSETNKKEYLITALSKIINKIGLQTNL